MKKKVLLVAAAVSVLLCACGNTLRVTDRKVMHETEFGGVYVDLTIDEFNALGFAFGDSVDVTFSNGYTLEDIPYYNGYYNRNGEALIVGYPGYPHIEICVNNGDPLWETAGLDEGDTVTIRRAKKGAFLDTQTARDIHYQDDRSAYASDVIFANFRAVEAGNIAPGRLCRSASPCDNQHNRAGYVDALMKEAGVAIILDLADNEEKIARYIGAGDFDSPYFLSLYEGGDDVPLAMNTNYGSEEFRENLATGLRAMASHEGPYLVHCTEGKDRTGFVCALLEALCGADYEEMRKDYMITYDNYYGISEGTDREKYDLIVRESFDPLVQEFIGDNNIDPSTADLASYAQGYLRSAGLTDEEIAALRRCLE